MRVKAIYLPKEFMQLSNFTYMLIKSNLNRLQGMTQKRTHLSKNDRVSRQKLYPTLKVCT